MLFVPATAELKHTAAYTKKEKNNCFFFFFLLAVVKKNGELQSELLTAAGERDSASS